MWGIDFWDLLLPVDCLRGVGVMSPSAELRSRSCSATPLSPDQLSISSSMEYPLPRIRCKVRIAIWGSLCAASHAGLSGTKHKPIPCTRPMHAPTPRMMRHRDPLLKVTHRLCNKDARIDHDLCQGSKETPLLRRSNLRDVQRHNNSASTSSHT